MSEKLPRITADQVIRVLERTGFSLVHKAGGHRVYRNGEGRRVTVPYHAGKILHPKVVMSIIADMDLTPDQFREMLK